VPFGISIATISYTPPGTEDSQDRPIAYDQNVDEGYFGALGIPILRGRGFTADEARAKAPVAVIDALFAQRHFGDSDPIGRQFKIGDEQDNANREFTIIGVVPTLKQRALNEVAERASIYRPNASPPYAALVVRTTFDPSALIAPLKAVGEEIGGPNALGTIVALEQRIADTLKDLTRLSGLLGLLGITALLLSAVGIYAVLGYVVRQRVPEFGVRMALGAHASNIVRSVLSQGLRLVGTGLALGVPLAWMFARVLSAKLHGVGTFDLPTLILVSLILGAIGLIACLLPALSAARVDPMVALRNE
jgi:ABC-type antimicrobial peptide transport system permease subunit